MGRYGGWVLGFGVVVGGLGYPIFSVLGFMIFGTLGVGWPIFVLGLGLSHFGVGCGVRVWHPIWGWGLVRPMLGLGLWVGASSFGVGVWVLCVPCWGWGWGWVLCIPCWYWGWVRPIGLGWVWSWSVWHASSSLMNVCVKQTSVGVEGMAFANFCCEKLRWMEVHFEIAGTSLNLYHTFPQRRLIKYCAEVRSELEVFDTHEV